MTSVPRGLAVVLLLYYVVGRRAFSDSPGVITTVVLPRLGASKETFRSNRIAHADDYRVPLVARGPFVVTIGGYGVVATTLSIARPLSISKQTLTLGATRLALPIAGETCMPLPQSQSVPINTCAVKLGVPSRAYYPPIDLYVPVCPFARSFVEGMDRLIRTAASCAQGRATPGWVSTARSRASWWPPPAP